MAGALKAGVKSVIEDLRRLQGMTLDGEVQGAPAAEEAEDLRKRLPTTILRGFDSMLSRGKRGIVAAINGVCSGCHLQLSSAAKSALVRPGELGRCDNCGRYLYLQAPGGATTADTSAYFSIPSAKPPPKPARRRRKESR